MPDILYRALLDNADVLRKLTQIEQRFVQVGSKATINVNINGLPAARNALNNLGGNRTLNYRINTIGNIGGLTGQLAAAEARMRSLTFAAGQNLGVTRALGGIFAFIPGPLGLYASAASAATGALVGLNAAQKFNTIGAFGLAGGLAAIGAATALLASRGIQQLKDFQTAANILTAQGGGAIGQVSAELDQKVRNLQTQGGRPASQFNRAELAGGVADLTKQGRNEAESLTLVAASLKLAGAEGEKLNTTTTLLNTNLRQFNVGTDQAGRFIDVFAKGSLLAAGTATDLQKGLSVVGSIASRAGFSLEQITGQLITLDNSGLAAATVGANALRAVLLALAAPTGKTKDELAKLNIELKNQDGSARSVRDILEELRQKTKGTAAAYSEADKAALMSADSVNTAANIFRSRGVVGFLNLTEAADANTKALENSAGTADIYANALTEGPAKAQERLKKSLDDLALSFAQTFGPKLTAGLDKIAQVFRDIDNATQHPEVLQAYFNVVISGFTGIAGAVLLTSDAAKALLAVSSFGGLVKLLSASVAGQLFTKVATGIRAIALATALNTFANGGSSFVGFITALNAIPVVAGVALAAIALLAAGVAVYANKIKADTAFAVAQNEKSDADLNTSQLKTINTLAKAGDDLSKQKARYLIALRELQAAQQGNVVGENRLGEVVYKVDESEVAKAQANLADQKKRLDGMRLVTNDLNGATLGAQIGKRIDRQATEAQVKAYGDLSQRLTDLKGKFGESKETPFQKNLQAIRHDVEALNKSIDESLKKGDLSPIQAKSLKRQAVGSQAGLIAGVTQRQLDEDAKTQTQHEQEIAAARLSIIKDSRQKRQGEYAAEVTALNEKYAPQIKEALQNATAQGITPAQKRSLQSDAGKLQSLQNRALVAAQNKLTSDLNDLDEERTKKVRDGATQRLQALASEMGTNTSALEASYKQAGQLAGDDAKARLAVETSLAPKLEQARLAARQSKLSADQTGLQNEYDDAIAAAKNQGAARVSLENAARETYLSKGRALQQAYETDVQGYAEARLQAVQEAGAAVTKKQLELDLEGVKQFTGAQLSAYSALYEAKRKAALAEGDPAKAKEFADALKTLSDTKFSNLADFKKQASEAVTSLGELRSKLADLNPNKDPVAEARKQAAAQYNPLITGAQKLKTDGRNSFNGLTPDQQSAQNATFKQQQGELSRFILDTSKQRGVATLRGQQEANRKIQDDAEQAAAKLAKTRYEANKGDSTPYLLALDKDRKYWEDRIALYSSKGAQFKDELAKAQQGLADNDASRTAVLATDRQIGQTRRALAVDEAQSALTLAQTEQERQIARAKLVSLTAQGLAALPAEIDAARKRGDSEETIAGLIRDQLKLKGDLKTFSEDDLVRADQQLARQRTLLETQLELATSDAQRLTIRAALLSNDQTTLQNAQARLDRAVSEGATLEKIADLEDKRDGAAKNVKADHEADLAVVDALLDSQLKLQASQDGYAAAIARSNAEVLSTKQSSLTTSQAELAQIGQRIAQAQQEGKTQTEINGLLSEYTQKQTSIYDQQKGIRTYLTGLDRQSLDLLEAQARSQAEITGASGDTTKAKLLDLDTTRKELAFNQQQLGSAGQNLLTEQEINDLKKARLGLLGQEAQQQRDLIQLGLQRQQSELDLSKARATLGLEQSGLGDSAPAAARAALDAAQKQLTIAQDRVAAASNLDDLTKAQTEEVNAQIGALVAQRTLVKARIDDESKTLGLLKAQGETRLALAGLDDNGMAKAQLLLDTANRELAASREQLALAKTADERRDAQTRNAGVVLGQLQAQRALVQAGLDAEQHQLDLLKAQSAARLILNRQNDDAVATAQESVRQAQAELDLARERVRLAQTPIQRQDAQGAELTAQATLISAREQLALAPLEAEQRHLNLLKAQVAERLELAGLQTNTVATGQAAVAQAQAELQLAQQRLALSQTQAKQEEAQIGVSSARTALSQAERALVQARVDVEQKSFDLLEAQVRGRAQITRLADDAVASAQIDLDVTKGKLGLVDRQLASAQSNRLTQEQINVLLKDQVGLQGQAVQQEDKLLEAQRARVTLLEGLSLAQSKLGSELQGGSPEARSTRDAINSVAEARAKLTQAEREYGLAQASVSRSQSSSNIEKYRAATENLTGAIAGQRTAVGNLANQYAALLSSQDNVRSASENLKKVLYGDAGQPFDGNKELDRFSAIQARRDVALRAAQQALKSGDAGQIAKTTDELAKQEDRYRKQAELLKTNGVDVSLQSSAAVERVAQQVDRLGIQYDREAEAVKAKQDVAQQESEAAITFSQGADTFTGGTASFDVTVAALLAGLSTPLQTDAEPLASAFSQFDATTTRLLEGLDKPLKVDSPQGQGAASNLPFSPARYSYDLFNASRVQQAVNQTIQTPRVAAPTPSSSGAGTGTKNQTFNQSYTFSITALPGQSAEDIGRVVEGKIRELNSNANIYGGCP